MSTIKTTNLQHPSAASPNLVLAADGSVSGGAGLGGLVLVSPTSIANSGGSASASGGQVSFTGVSSVSLNGVFTSAYENYQLVISITASSADSYQDIRWRISGTDATGANYSYANIYVDGTSGAGRTIDQTVSRFGYHDSTDAGSYVVLNVFRPNLAVETNFFSNSLYRANGANTIAGFMFWQRHGLATAYDGFTIFPESGSITGTIRVYGYKNS